MMLAVAFMVGSIVLLELGSRWTVRWQSHAVRQSGIFCYRRSGASELFGREGLM